MHRYDEFLESDSCIPEIKRTIQMNKIFMKILVDIELSAKILFNESLKKTYKIVKFAIDLHKSIQTYESKDFALALNRFPNKKQGFFHTELLGERKIV